MTITFISKPNSTEEIYATLHPFVREWFVKKFETFTPPQSYGIIPIHCRESILISSSTGSGKTLTAFTSILNELVDSSTKGILEDKIYAIYISPLKALGKDIKHNLLEPLSEIEAIAKQDLNIRVAVRTGDTTAYERQKMLSQTPHILITTPESLALLLISPKFKEKLRLVDWVIIDEIHAIAENKRGVHLSLLLEHLQYKNPGLTRIGLSATVAPLKDVAQYLVGAKRDCLIADVSHTKNVDLEVVTPVKDLVNTSYENIQSQLYLTLHELISAHKTTLVFTNTRSGTERLVHTLKEKYPESYIELQDKDSAKENEFKSLIAAHHGSLSKEHRESVEDELRKGNLKAVVCSTSLELGIDIGSIDLVVLLGSPKSVARALQRVGRSGHRLSAVTKGRIVVLDRDDLIECSVLLKFAKEQTIDRIHIPLNSFDVLVQHMLGFVLQEPISLNELFEITKESYCYKDLAFDDFYEIFKYLAGDFESLENRYIFSKIRLDEQVLKPKGKLTRMLYASNLGTIPSSSAVLVKIGDVSIGTIDEGFLEKLKRGDRFVLGGDVYEFLYAKGMVAYVSATYGKTPTIPNWYSESLPLSFDLSLGIQACRGRIFDCFTKQYSKAKCLDFIKEYLYVSLSTAQAVYSYMYQQYLFTKHPKKDLFPKRDNFVIEEYSEDVLGAEKDSSKKYLLIHSLHGRRVNEALSRVFAYIAGKFYHCSIEVGVNDNGFYLATQKKIDLSRALSFVSEDEFIMLLHASIKDTEIIKRRFRQCAERSLMILRSYKGSIKNAGRQQVSSMILLKAAKKISENFIILREAYREVMEDVMDVKNAELVFKTIINGSRKIVTHEFSAPSPFAIKLLMQGFSDVISISDRHTFLQNMHKVILTKIAKKPNLNDEELLDTVNTLRELSQLETISSVKREYSENEKLLFKMVSKTTLPKELKAIICALIRDKDLSVNDEKILQEKRLILISTLPPKLKGVVFQYLDSGSFEANDVLRPVSYEHFWEKQKKVAEEKKEEALFLLRKDILLASKKRAVPFEVTNNLLESLDSERTYFSEKTKQFFVKEFEKAVPKAWSDSLYKYITSKLKD